MKLKALLLLALLFAALLFVRAAEVEMESEEDAEEEADVPKDLKSCAEIKLVVPSATSGTYEIKTTAGQQAVFCDMTTDGGGYTHKACTGCKDVRTTTEVNGCDKFGMNMVVPRSQAHWQSLYKYVTVELKSTMDSHFKVVPGISKSVGGRNDCNGGTGVLNYEACKDSKSWRAIDGGKWWLRTSTYSEPNGDYTANQFLGGLSNFNNGKMDDMTMNDSTTMYTSGANYVCSTNDFNNGLDGAIEAPGNNANYVVFRAQSVTAARFRFNFEAKASNDVIVSFMCTREMRPTNSWEVLIGGWGNTRSVIRKGSEGQELVARNNDKGRTDGSNYKSYSIFVENGKMYVSDNGDEFMSVNVPSLGCDTLMVGLGGYDKPVRFKNIDVANTAYPTLVAPVNSQGALNVWNSDKVFATGFEFKFAAKATTDVSVTFTCQKAAKPIESWTVVIGGYSNTKSVIRTSAGEVSTVAGARCNPNAFKSYTIWYSVGTMVVKDGNTAILTATNLPAPSCGKMFVGFSNWDKEVAYQVISNSAVAPARSAYDASGVKVDVFGNKVKKAPASQADISALKKAQQEKKQAKTDADARLTVANKAAQDAVTTLQDAKTAAAAKVKELADEKIAAGKRKAAAEKALNEYILETKGQDEKATKAKKDKLQEQADKWQQEENRIQAEIDSEKVVQAKYVKKQQALVDLAQANAARAAYLAQDAKMQFDVVSAGQVPAQVTTTQLMTPANSVGNANHKEYMYLDRHEVKCEGGFVNQFQLTRPTTETIAYKYTCVKPSTPVDSQKCVTKNFSEGPFAGGDYANMLHMNTLCNSQIQNGAISSFKAVFDGNKQKMSYTATCCSVAVDTCASVTTPASTYGEGEYFYLDRQNVQCPAGQVMQNFQLHAGAQASGTSVDANLANVRKTGWSYTSTCCKLAPVVVALPATPLAKARATQEQSCKAATAAAGRMADLKAALEQTAAALKDAESDEEEARKAAAANPNSASRQARQVSAEKNVETAQKAYAQVNKDFLTAQGQVTVRKNACSNAAIAIRKAEEDELKQKFEEIRQQQAALVKAAADAAAEKKKISDALQKKCAEEIKAAEDQLEANRKAFNAANQHATEENNKNAKSLEAAQAEKQLADAKTSSEITAAQDNLNAATKSLSAASEAAHAAAEKAHRLADEAEAARKRADDAAKARRELERKNNAKVIADMEDAQDKARKEAERQKGIKAQAIIDQAERDLKLQGQLEKNVEAAAAAAQNAEKALKKAQDAAEDRKIELRELEAKLREVEKLLEIALKELALAQTKEQRKPAARKAKELKKVVATTTTDVTTARAAYEAAQRNVEAKRIALEKSIKVLADAQDAENKRAIAAAAKLSDATKKAQDETKRVTDLQAELDRKAAEERKRREDEYNTKTKEANAKLQQLAQEETARRAELKTLEDKLKVTRKGIVDTTKEGKDGEAELLRLKEVQQKNEIARKKEQVRLAEKATAAQQRAIQAQKDLHDATDKRTKIEKDNADKAKAYKEAMEKKSKDLSDAVTYANTKKAVAEATLKTLIEAQADQKKIDEAKKKAVKASEEADVIKRAAETTAAQSEAARVSLEKTALSARKAALDKEEECRRLVKAAQNAAATAEADAKKATDLSVQHAQAAVNAATSAQNLAKVAAEWNKKAMDAAQKTGEAQAAYNKALSDSTDAQKVVDTITAELNKLKANPPAYMSTDDLTKRINQLKTDLAQATKDWDEAKQAIEDTKVAYEKTRADEQTVINNRQAANDLLKTKLTGLQATEQKDSKDAQLIQTMLDNIQIQSKNAATAKLNAQAAWEEYQAAYKRQIVSDAEAKRLQAQMNQIKDQNSSEFAAAEANLKKMKAQVEDNTEDLAAAKKDFDTKKATADKLEAELVAKRKELDAAQSTAKTLKTQQNANWRDVHTARSDAVNTLGRQNKA